jgi:catechol 2,3-dioxygenase
MQKFTIHPATTVGTVTLTVANLEAMVEFYRGKIGLAVRDRVENRASLGTAGEDILILVQNPTAKHVSGRTGLYHFAILLPTRPDLGHWLRHLAEQRYPLSGYSDHGVSEALYLDDPEGNGIEVYRDRPRDQWPLANGRLAMVSDPIDLRALVAEAPAGPFTGVPEGTTLGHVHLKVDDTRKAETFYVDLLGFDWMQAIPGATFLSAGGYHHHLGANTWHSAGAPPPPPDSLGLHSYTIQLPDEAERSRLMERLEATNTPFEPGPDGPLLHDPAGNAVVLTVA